MGVVAWILTVAYLGLAVLVVYLAVTRTPIFSASRLEGHVPDPRDAEIVFLRERVVDLEAKLHGTQREFTADTASLLRDHLLGRSTGLPDDTVVDDTGIGTVVDPELGAAVEDWTDVWIAAAGEKVPPPPDIDLG